MESIELARQFASRFGVRPAIFSAPGRVNLIGEHTDYNEGFVMPSAIGLCTRVAISARQDRQLFIQSEQFPGHSVFDLDDLPKRSTGAWCDYVLGVAVVLQQAGHSLQGANLFVHGEIPMGAGLSSSAAIEVPPGGSYQTILTIQHKTDRCDIRIAKDQLTIIGPFPAATIRHRGL